MNRAQKIVLGIALALCLLLAATVTWAASTVVRDGLVTVRVHAGGAGGTHIYLPIPGSAVRAAMHAVRWSRPQQRRFSARLAEIRPILSALGDELAAAPDVRLVEVESDGEHVVVEKRGGEIRITVDDGGDHVRITFPIDLASDLLDELGAVI